MIVIRAYCWARYSCCCAGCLHTHALCLYCVSSLGELNHRQHVCALTVHSEFPFYEWKTWICSGKYTFFRSRAHFIFHFSFFFAADAPKIYFSFTKPRRIKIEMGKNAPNLVSIQLQVQKAQIKMCRTAKRRILRTHLLCNTWNRYIVQTLSSGVISLPRVAMLPIFIRFLFLFFLSPHRTEMV